MKKIKKRIAYILISLAVIYFVLLPLIDFCCLKFSGKCTTGVVVDVHIGARGYKSSIYRYHVDGVEYYNQCSRYKKEFINSSFLILYDETNPNRSVLYYEYPQTGFIGDAVGECKKDNLLFKVYQTGANYYNIYFK